jgi:hypothetical protein
MFGMQTAPGVRDVPGQMISLSQDQFVMLENLPFFEKR